MEIDVSLAPFVLGCSSGPRVTRPKTRTKQWNIIVRRYIIELSDFSGLQVPMFFPVFFNGVLRLKETSF